VANEEKILALLGQIAADVSEVKVRMGSMEARMDSLEARVGSVEARIDSLEARMDSMEVRMDRMEADISGIKIRLDVDVERNFKLLAEGHEMLREHVERTSVPMDRVERIENDVIVLKSACKDLNQRVSVLEAAQ
jgi:chaperonin cofactor prefoldin